MNNLSANIAHLNLDGNSVGRSLQIVRGRLERASSEINGASSFIKGLLGLDVEFTNNDVARVASFAATLFVIEAPNHTVDVNDVWQRAMTRANAFVSDPINAWLFVREPVVVAGKEAEQAVVDGIQTKVAVKADGSIKKGGLKILALEMYKREVEKGEVDRKAFTKSLMSELGMSLEGARTYAYNARKEYESSMQNS